MENYDNGHAILGHGLNGRLYNQQNPRAKKHARLRFNDFMMMLDSGGAFLFWARLERLHKSSWAVYSDRSSSITWSAGPMARRLTTNQEIAGSIPASIKNDISIGEISLLLDL